MQLDSIPSVYSFAPASIAAMFIHFLLISLISIAHIIVHPSMHLQQAWALPNMLKKFTYRHYPLRSHHFRSIDYIHSLTIYYH
jgi:hypothetical protein